MLLKEDSYALARWALNKCIDDNYTFEEAVLHLELSEDDDCAVFEAMNDIMKCAGIAKDLVELDDLDTKTIRALVSPEPGHVVDVSRSLYARRLEGTKFRVGGDDE